MLAISWRWKFTVSQGESKRGQVSGRLLCQSLCTCVYFFSSPPCNLPRATYMNGEQGHTSLHSLPYCFLWHERKKLLRVDMGTQKLEGKMLCIKEEKTELLSDSYKCLSEVWGCGVSSSLVSQGAEETWVAVWNSKDSFHCMSWSFI